MFGLIKRISVVVALAVLVAGCGAGGGPLITGNGPTGQVVVVNRSSATITVVTVSECSHYTHGGNRLPSGLNLSPGQSYGWTVTSGCWDVQAGYGNYDGSYAVADFRVNVGAGGPTVLTVTN